VHELLQGLGKRVPSARLAERLAQGLNALQPGARVTYPVANRATEAGLHRCATLLV
jgi:hypothetical protein